MRHSKLPPPRPTNSPRDSSSWGSPPAVLSPPPMSSELAHGAGTNAALNDSLNDLQVSSTSQLASPRPLASPRLPYTLQGPARFIDPAKHSPRIKGGEMVWSRGAWVFMEPPSTAEPSTSKPKKKPVREERGPWIHESYFRKPKPAQGGSVGLARRRLMRQSKEEEDDNDDDKQKSEDDGESSVGGGSSIEESARPKRPGAEYEQLWRPDMSLFSSAGGGGGTSGSTYGGGSQARRSRASAIDHSTFSSFDTFTSSWEQQVQAGWEQAGVTRPRPLSPNEPYWVQPPVDKSPRKSPRAMQGPQVPPPPPPLALHGLDGVRILTATALSKLAAPRLPMPPLLGDGTWPILSGSSRGAQTPWRQPAPVPILGDGASPMGSPRRKLVCVKFEAVRVGS